MRIITTIKSISETPRLWGLRVSIVLYVISITILSNVYRGSLVSFLTRPILLEPLNTIEDVVNSPLQVRTECHSSYFHHSGKLQIEKKYLLKRQHNLY